MTATTPRPHRFQFTLRQMLLSVFFCALASAALAPIARASPSDRFGLILMETVAIPPTLALFIRFLCRPSPWTLWLATLLGLCPIVAVGGILLFGEVQMWITDQVVSAVLFLPLTLGWLAFGLLVTRRITPKSCPVCGRRMLREEGRRTRGDRLSPPYTALCVACKGRFRRWHLGYWEADELSG